MTLLNVRAAITFSELIKALEHFTYHEMTNDNVCFDDARKLRALGNLISEKLEKDM